MQLDCSYICAWVGCRRGARWTSPCHSCRGRMIRTTRREVHAVTAIPQPPGHLLTVREYACLGEDEHGRCELMEGNLLMAPSPTPDHMIALGRLYRQLARQ